jgi:hypothetical protein
MVASPGLPLSDHDNAVWDLIKIKAAVKMPAFRLNPTGLATCSLI